MLWSTTVLSAPTSDTEPTILISFDSAKYIFNVGENTGRTFMEGTQRASGLPGMFMLLADASFKKMSIVGPPGLTHWLASMRGYVYRSGMQVNALEIESSSAISAVEPPAVYQDGNLTVYGIPLLSKAPLQDDPIDIQEGQSLPSKRKLAPSYEPNPKRQRFLHNSAARHAAITSGGLTLQQQSESTDFMPYYLHGKDAQDWRKLVLGSMFPYVHPPQQPKGERQGKKGKGKAAAALDGGESTASSSAMPEKPVTLSGRARSRRLPPALDELPPSRFCYVCIGPRVRGKFDVEKAKELGVPSGPIRKRLIQGEAITFTVSDGQGGTIERTVQPSEIVEPAETPRVVIIIDVNSPDQISHLMAYFTESPFYRKFRSKREEDLQEYVVSTVIHLCGDNVLEDPRYVEFMNGFADSVHHVISSRKHTPDMVTFGSAAYNQLKLHHLDPNMFPTQNYRKEPERNLSDVPGLPPNSHLLEANLHVGVRPSRPPVTEELSETYNMVHTVVSESAPLELPQPTLNAFTRARAQYATLENDIQKAGPQPGDDVVVTPLGTSSALPNRFRNVSSTAVEIPRWGNILLDAGEGTWGQLTRLFGDDVSRSQGVWQFMRDLKCIFLSHIHGDHHIGLAKILAKRKELEPPPNEPLYVIGVRQQLLYLREMADIEDLALDAPGGNGVISILSDALNWRRPAPYYDPVTLDMEPWTDRDASRAAAAAMCRSLGLNSFTSVDVDHGTRCYGAVIKHSDGWSIAFSADTLPTENLVQAGQGATLLIHEATMADDQEDLARAKHHSTFSQAINIGRRMHAKNILLTHFSARYPKMPQSEAIPAKAGEVKVPENDGQPIDVAPGPVSNTPDVSTDGPTPVLGLAFDHTKIRIGDMRKLNTYLPAI